LYYGSKGFLKVGKGYLTEDQLFALLKSWDKTEPILEKFALIGIREALIDIKHDQSWGSTPE